MKKSILITGGAGFIGHQVIKEVLLSTDWNIFILDRLSYSGNLKRINDVINETDSQNSNRVEFVFHDLKAKIINENFATLKNVNYIIHIGASSHVTNSIENPETFLQDNIVGTFNLLEFSRKLEKLELFYYFSTDEVFGPSSGSQKFLEWDRYNSKNPYSATKAAAEELVIAYQNTYNINSIISHCSNVYGIRQHKEKFIPNTIWKILNNKEVIVHTNNDGIPGSRYYIHNEDVAKSTIYLVKNFKKNYLKVQEIQKTLPNKFNISGNSLISNFEIVEKIGTILSKEFSYTLISKDPQRPSHDFKYGLDTSLLESIGGRFDQNFNLGLESVVKWYMKNPFWLN